MDGCQKMERTSSVCAKWENMGVQGKHFDEYTTGIFQNSNRQDEEQEATAHLVRYGRVLAKFDGEIFL